MKIRKISLSDDYLVEAIREGGKRKEEAIKYIINKNIGFIYKIQRKLHLDETAAKDAYLDAVVAVMQQIENSIYRRENKISSYLYQIFYFKSVDIVRRSATNLETYVEEFSEQEDESKDTLLTLEQEEQVKRIVRILDNMGEPCKQILMDWGFWGYSIQDIAARMNVDDPLKISRRKYKCLEEIRERLQQIMSL
jgi:RNA polymerase sigma factor (sigma-70 family)